VIAFAIFLQVLQVVVSILQRKANPAGNDPWNGRTLEWATTSPPPHYNFATIPQVEGKDAFWMMKQKGETLSPGAAQEIELPTNTPVGLFVAGFSFLFGFGLIWHIWWLAIAGVVGCIALLVADSFRQKHGEH